MSNNTLPPLPEPWSAASTIKCTACGRPYKPAIAAGVAAPLRWGMVPSPACECGNNSWKGTLGEGQVPAKYTAEQMRDYANLAAQLPPGFILVPTDVLRRCRDTAMLWTIKARVPECGEFGGIAQDLDALLAAAET